jgi:DNA-binding transcriptional ArsR family regulator
MSRFTKQGRRPATEAEAKALASGLRMRILRLCLDRPLTNKEIAARLEANPATILHHVRTLVATGFLEALPERRGTRGAREVPYLSTGKSWVLSADDTNVPGGGQATIDAFLDEIRHIDINRAPEPELRETHVGLARLGLRLPPAQIAELQDRLDELLQDFADREPDLDEGVPYSIFMALYPDVTRP